MRKKEDLNNIYCKAPDGFSVIADYDGSEEQLMKTEVDSSMPILPLRNMVLFPGVFLPVTIGRKSSLKLIHEAEAAGKNIGIVCQKLPDTEYPELKDLHQIGTVARIIRTIEMPDKSRAVILQGIRRFKLEKITETTPYLLGNITPLEDEMPSQNDKEFQALVDSIKDTTIHLIKTSDLYPQESTIAIKNNNSPVFVINFISANLPLKKDDKMQLLCIDSFRDRAYQLLRFLNREVQLAEIKENIQIQAREDIDQQQREYFLQQQIKTIQNELGGNGQEQEIEEMRSLAKTKHWSEEVKNTFLKEVDKLERTHAQSPEYNVQLNYLQTMLNLPWGEYTTDNLNLNHATKVLNKDHYGLEKVKERILEHLAVLKLKGDMKSPIICLSWTF